MRSLVPRHPYALGRLFSFRFRHNAEFSTKEVVEKGGFPCRLGSEDGDEVVIESRLADFLERQIVRESMAAL